MIVNKAMYPVSRDLRTITDMQKQFENLQLQLATGKRYNTLAEMGGDRVHDINIRGRLNRIEGFQSNILTVENRMSFYTNGLERLDEIEASARKLAVPGAYGTDGINFINSRNQATNLMKEVIDVLNTDITGQYIFGGNASDTKPVASFDEIMGAFREAVTDHNDTQGVGDRGHVAVGPAGTGNLVTLEDNADDTTGIILKSVEPTGAIAKSTTGSTHELTFPDHVPNGDNIQPGDTVKIGYALPDDRDTVKYVTLTAVAEGVEPVPANAFKVNADGNVTATNFENAVGKSLDFIAQGELRSASTYMAADDFFVGRNETPPASVAWYRGQDVDANKNPRQTVSANVDENTKAHYGVQANEKGFVELMKGLAVFAVTEDGDMAELNDLNASRYEALVSRQRARLSEDNNSKPGSIEVITMELGLAASTVNTVKERHTQYNAQLETMLSDISNAPREEVAMMLMTLQTQLTASYQATSMASQLTLVNFLR